MNYESNHSSLSLCTIVSTPFFSAYMNHMYKVYSTELSGFLVSSFISIYFLNTLFTEINLPWLIYESIKALEIKTLNLL